MNSFDDASRARIDALKCELAAEVLRSSGALRLGVMGWSMLPTVWPGDTLVIERVGFEGVSEGDIVLFGRGRRLFAHRVVAKRGNLNHQVIHTQGDGMFRPDTPVKGADLMGKVSSILRNGKCLDPKLANFSERVVAALVRRFDSVARLAVRLHGMRPSRQEQIAPCQN
jgi:hypothetical protein